MPGDENTRKKKLCFVVGPIGSSGSDIRKNADMILNGVIKYSIDEAKLNYEVRRADDDVRPGMINDRIIHDIINADLVISDLTGLNPNVFYELGIRHATEKPTIHLSMVGTVLPFDNHGHDTIFVDVSDWHDIVRVRARLLASIKAIEASDYRVSNPITQAKATFEMRSSSDPRDIMIADLRDRLSAIESTEKQRILLENSHTNTIEYNYNKLDRFLDDLISQISNYKHDDEVTNFIMKQGSLHGLKIRNLAIGKDEIEFRVNSSHVNVERSGTGASVNHGI